MISVFKSKKKEVRLGILAMLIEIFISMIIATIVKLTTVNVPVSVVLLARYIFCLPILLVFGFWTRKMRLFHINNISSLTVRIIAGFSGLLFWFLAISKIEISVATGLLQTMVIFITLFSALFLKEKVLLLHWIAIFIGLIGTLILVSPKTNFGLNLGVFYGIAAPISAALMYISLRRLGGSDQPISTALWYNSMGAFLMTVWCFYSKANLIYEKSTLLILIACGLIASFQQISLAISHKLAEASTLAPLQYISIPLATFVGYFLFDEILSLNFFIGTILIVTTSYFIIYLKNKNGWINN